MLSSTSGDLAGPGASLHLKVPVIARDLTVFYAVEQGNLHFVKQALSVRRASPQTISGSGKTLLHWAAGKAEWGIYELLCSVGFDEAWEDEDQMSPLDHLLQLWPKSPRLAESIGSTVDTTRFTSLHEAVVFQANRSSSLTEFMEHNYADVNVGDKTGMTPLHWATRRGDLAGVNLLLSWKADPNRQDTRGCTALHYACRKRVPMIAKALLNAGSQVGMTDNDGRPPHFSLQDTKDDMLDTLLKHGANINHFSHLWGTALHYAAFMGRAGVCSLFVERGLDINASAPNGWKPIDHAVFENSVGCVSALLSAAEWAKRSIDWSAGPNGRNVLHHAAIYAGVGVFDVLAATELVGLDPLAANKNGEPPAVNFCRHRDANCAIIRDDPATEKAAWWNLMESACRRNNVDPFDIPEYCEYRRELKALNGSNVEIGEGGGDGDEDDDEEFVDAPTSIVEAEAVQ
ncbi:uncharacterized protein LTR77_003437 [Saxophila tyrrhenica]|uniref:Uncharacterized protein n=1 Tax=Saxophila tyrrhenica TaxID=1690608 RepID=A0AAV9PDR5_9PEZI|nr:hypothetical protein LTR77_003437 [Saxophila tyrrhenica]